MSGNIQSVQRALAIFEYIVNHAGAGVSELSRELQLNKSTVFSLLKTLENLGYIYKNAPTDTYQVTHRIQTLAQMDTNPHSIVGYARPFLEKLHAKYDETVHFIRAAKNEVVYLDKLESTKSIRIHSGVGETMPLHCTGVGKSILAWRSEEEIEAYADRTGLPALTAHTITDLETLKEELRRVRAQEFSIDNEENQEGLYCIGVPVFNRTGDVQFAISLSIPKYRKNEIELSAAVSDLKEAARALLNFF